MIDLGIGIIPDEKASVAAIRLNETLREEYDTSYKLGRIFYPHLTLYQSTFDRLEDLSGVLKHLHLPEKLKTEKIHVKPSNFVVLACEKSKETADLHSKIVNLASEVRLKTDDDIWKRKVIFNLTPEQEENKRKYGFINVFTSFAPHMTIGRVTDRMSDSEREQLEDLLNEEARGLMPSVIIPLKLVIYEVGIDGGCNNPVDIHGL